MDTTRGSLLIRLRDHDDRIAWRDFYALYGPLVYRYARQRGLSDADSEDVRSHALQTVAEQIGKFDYRRDRGGLRAWLRRIVINRTIDMLRTMRGGHAHTSQLEQLIAHDDVDEVWEREWERTLLLHALNEVRARVPERTLQIFQLLVMEDKAVSDVAAIFGTSANQVYKAKSEVLAIVRELRQELLTTFEE